VSPHQLGPLREGETLADVLLFQTAENPSSRCAWPFSGAIPSVPMARMKRVGSRGKISPFSMAEKAARLISSFRFSPFPSFAWRTTRDFLPMDGGLVAISCVVYCVSTKWTRGVVGGGCTVVARWSSAARAMIYVPACVSRRKDLAAMVLLSSDPGTPRDAAHPARLLTDFLPFAIRDISDSAKCCTTDTGCSDTETSARILAFAGRWSESCLRCLYRLLPKGAQLLGHDQEKACI
jgi:hypothetical protein